MYPLQTILVLLFAFLAVFGETVFGGLRNLLGAQIDLLPALMVYAALNTSLTTVSLLAFLGGLWFDSLSANHLGVTILPLMLVGFGIYVRRDLILRVPFAQVVLGAIANAVVPALTLMILLNGSWQPLIGWGSLWQWFVMTAGGAAATPIIFALFQWCDRTFGYQPRSETSFRPDREIQRDRNNKPA